jgi:hypothetical protein
MPLSALALVVLAGFIHASWNIAAKKAGGDRRFVAFTSVVLALFWAPLGLWLGISPSLLRERPTVVRLWCAQWPYACVVGVFSPVSHVAPAREVSMLIAAGVMALGWGA